VGSGYPFPPGEGSGEKAKLCPLPRKKKNFLLEMACFGAF